MPNVYNKRHTYPADAVYVGRGSNWGNPFRVGRDGTRAEVIEAFEAYADAILKKKPDWLEHLRGKDLVCWCFPEACHADVLLRLANAEPENTRPFVIRSNRVSEYGFRATLCEGKMLEDGRIRITWTSKRVFVQLQEQYASMDALLAELETENVRCIVWQNTGEYQFINRE